jgi:OmcA/MtrC family decaheme c-type cytochrome
MIHGIHGASAREYPMEFYRGGSHGGYYAWITHDQLEDYPEGTVVAYPGDLNDCETCHFEGTYLPEEIPMDALVSIYQTTTGGEETIESLEEAHDNVPNDADLIYSPAVGACASCHNGEAAIAHMEQNGGAYMWTRDEYLMEMPYESCSVCHGEGSSVDITVAHGM